MITNLFLIDDDPDELLIFQEAIDAINSSIKLHLITRCSELEKSLIEVTPDIVFLDINMHTLDGFGWLDFIRQKGYSLPVVMYSNSSDKKDIEKSYRGGAMIYMVKPVNFDGLVKSLDSLFAMDLKEPKQVQQRYFSDQVCKVFDPIFTTNS